MSILFQVIPQVVKWSQTFCRHAHISHVHVHGTQRQHMQSKSLCRDMQVNSKKDTEPDYQTERNWGCYDNHEQNEVGCPARLTFSSHTQAKSQTTNLFGVFCWWKHNCIKRWISAVPCACAELWIVSGKSMEKFQEKCGNQRIRKRIACLKFSTECAFRWQT